MSPSRSVKSASGNLDRVIASMPSCQACEGQAVCTSNDSLLSTRVLSCVLVHFANGDGSAKDQGDALGSARGRESALHIDVVQLLDEPAHHKKGRIIPQHRLTRRGRSACSSRNRMLWSQSV